MHRFVMIEKEIISFFSVLLILFDLVSLYFIVDLLSYDEIMGYFPNGKIKSDSPRNLAFILLVGCTLNLLFISISLMATIFLSLLRKILNLNKQILLEILKLKSDKFNCFGKQKSKVF